MCSAAFGVANCILCRWRSREISCGSSLKGLKMIWRLGRLVFSQWGNVHAAFGDGRLGATGRALVPVDDGVGQVLDDDDQGDSGAQSSFSHG